MKSKLTPKERRIINAALPILKRQARQGADDPRRCPECGGLVDEDDECEDCQGYVPAVRNSDPPLPVLTVNNVDGFDTARRSPTSIGDAPLPTLTINNFDGEVSGHSRAPIGDAPLPTLTVNNVDDY